MNADTNFPDMTNVDGGPEWNWAFNLIAKYGPCPTCNGPVRAQMEWEPINGKAAVYYEAKCLNRQCKNGRGITITRTSPADAVEPVPFGPFPREPMFEDWFYRHGGGVMFQRPDGKWRVNLGTTSPSRRWRWYRPDDLWRLACWHVWHRRYW